MRQCKCQICRIYIKIEENYTTSRNDTISMTKLFVWHISLTKNGFVRYCDLWLVFFGDFTAADTRGHIHPMRGNIKPRHTGGMNNSVNRNKMWSRYINQTHEVEICK